MAIPCQPVMGDVETMNKKDLVKYIVAFTYGDGYLGKHGKYSRFQANNIVDNRDYIEWRASILSELTKVTIKEKEDTRGNRKTILSTATLTHPLYDKIRFRMYLKGRKVIDPHYLKLFDWETLAILYMDDGNLRNNIRHYKDKIYFCTPTPNLATMSFSYGDNLLLKKTIKDNLGIEFNIHKHSKSKSNNQNYILDLLSSSYDRFIDGVKPFIFPSFEYKICSNAELSK